MDLMQKNCTGTIKNLFFNDFENCLNLKFTEIINFALGFSVLVKLVVNTKHT